MWGAIAEGDLGSLDFVPRFRRSGGGSQVGDLLWTGGTAMKVASRRFVEVLRSVDAEGYRTFPVDLVDARGREMDGFVGLAIDLEAGPTAAVRTEHPWQSFRFLVTDALHDALHDAGVTRFRSTRLS